MGCSDEVKLESWGKKGGGETPQGFILGHPANWAVLRHIHIHTIANTQTD